MPVDAEDAQLHWKKEVPAWDFKALRRRSRAAWMSTWIGLCRRMRNCTT